ncbi:DUF6351 family protein [Ramlibacter sp. PS3R-8]|uniref:DUF6351 family protein n=1 Tax=Ramlibacter sp. PS3R-8 TaxID=3133437 RepID=UPI00309B36D8
MLAIHAAPRIGAWRLGAVALATLVLVSCGGGGGDTAAPPGPTASMAPRNDRNDNTPFRIRTVNNRADLVSGGDAMIEVTAPPGTINSGVLKITRNGTDVTSAFAETGKRTVQGLVTGLVNGDNVIEATVRGGPGARLVVTNAPRQGPVLSGAHITPFYCATPVPVPGVGNTPTTLASGLSGDPDPHCNIPTETKLYYRTTAAAGTCSTSLPTATPPANSCWQPYTPATPAASIATTTTDNGQTVPFIVRLERGTMNRGIYDLAVLYNPAQPWDPVAPQAQWNGKVYYTFGASTGQPRRQARPATNWASQEEQLKRGFLIVSNSMTDSSRNSNRVLMSETTMMMKEHIADTYGEIKYTLGNGCSGGSINSNMNASISPGLLDGVITTCTYPDSETTSMEVGDCVLLIDAYVKPPMSALWTGLTPAQVNAKKAAINGHVDPSACHGWFNAFGNNGRAGIFTPRLVGANGIPFNSGAPTNNCELPNSAVYNPADPVNTAHLPRCNAWSWAESIWGKAGSGPAANDTRDNEGVQYGLKALKDHVITAEEFVTLNELVGGIDRDSTARAARSTGDTVALETAYRAGIVASGKQLAKTAIIDMRGWDDSNITFPTTGPSSIPIHHQWFSFAVRDRIQRDYGDYGNQALWRFARTGLSPTAAVALDAFNQMDQWLNALVADTSTLSVEQKVRATRPDGTKDFCLLSNDTTQASKVYDQAACDADPFLKPSLSPRQVAGGPRAEDVLKCQLKPLAAADYGDVVFSATQWSRLNALFSTGVCDWSRPGVGQQLAESPLTFKAGPGGQPLPPAPVSTKK